MKIRDQKGFGAAEAIVILVVLLVIAGAGYWVWQKHSKTTTVSTTASTATTPGTKASITKQPLTNDQILTKLRSMYKTYLDSTLGSTPADRIASVKAYFEPDFYQKTVADEQVRYKSGPCTSTAEHGCQDLPYNYDVITCHSFDKPFAELPTPSQDVGTNPTVKGNSVTYAMLEKYNDGSSQDGSDQVTVNNQTGLITDKFCMQ